MMSTQQKTDVNVIAIENNSWSNAALDDEGRVWTWGNEYNLYRLGRITDVATSTVNPYNRGGQVTTTIYPGENLPFILQISGSVQNTLALDRDGNVWSWGINLYNATGRSGSNTRPGKVEFPEGVKIKWIAAAFYGGKAIDTEGNIWVWGYGYQYGLGTGNTTSVSTPVKLTLDSNNNPLPTNFTKISSSDYQDNAAAIAITEDGEIFTWGNNASSSKAGASRPMQTGFNNDIKKIDVGNGTYGFLTNSGEIWTWGDNQAVAIGRQGHGDPLDRTAPKLIETVASDGIKPAPKFKDFSIYAWSMCAVDYEGNIYGCGENGNNKHTGPTSLNRLTKYSPNGILADTKIFVLAEGYTSTSYVDIYGNAYVTGQANAQGNNNNDGSPAGPWVHFTGSGKLPIFTLLSSEPTSEAKRYNTLPRTTLNVETNIAADEVKYVIIYPDDTDKYTDGETFYSKSFAEFEQPYYLKDTDPQLLLSPNYDLWTSRYYANPKISEDVFDAAFSIKTESDKGTMDIVPTSGKRAFQKTDLVSHNCIVWVQSKNPQGTTRAIYRFDNYYTQTKAWFEGVKLSDPSFNLYMPELVGGSYGLFLDRHGNIIPGEPPFKYDIVKPVPHELDYWMLSPDTQLAEEIAEDGYTHRIDRSKEVFLTNTSQMGNEATKTPKVTFTYEKNPQMWVDVDLYFVNESGDPVEVMINNIAVTHEPRSAFAPKGVAYVDGQEPYLPPEASNPISKVVGYSVGTKPEGTAGDYTTADFPNGFRPIISEKTDIFIVYSSGIVSVTETFIDITEDPENPIKNNDGLLSVIKNLRQGIDNYDSPGPPISNYVIVGHEIIVGGSSLGTTEYQWNNDRYEPVNASIPIIGNDATVRFLYKQDSNGNNIPDDEEGTIQVNWIAVSASNISYPIAHKTLYGNGKENVSERIFEDKANVLPTPAQWIFHPPQPTDEAPYLPLGNTSPVEITYTAGYTQNVYFYYDEDYNENGFADKHEGQFTERYKLYSSGSDLVPPRADTVSKWLGGQTYSKEAPLIRDYVAVGYMIEADGSEVAKTERIERENTGNVVVVYKVSFEDTKEKYTVTFFYKEDKNNNNIPDDEEGSVTIKWVGTTFAGNTVELASLVVAGYIGDDARNMIYQPTYIDDIWKLVSSDIPDKIILTSEPQSYTYKYRETPEFSTITIETTSTDGKLDFFYQYTKKLTDEAFDVTAFVIPTYRVKGYTLYDNYGTEIKSGKEDTIKIDPSSGSQRVVFIYESTITTVVIRAIESGNSENVLQSQTLTDAVIGQKYSATAPYVDDTWVLTGEILQVINVAEGTNYITFEYEKATGNITIILKEMDTNGQTIKVLSDTVTQGNKKNIPIPDLTKAYYTPTSTAEIVVNYDGSAPVPQIVEYYYAKDMMDVTIKAVDGSTGLELKSVSYPAAARKGESYTAIAPFIEWYTLTESNSKSVYADPTAANNTIIVDFIYKRDAIGNITVRSIYNNENNNEVELQIYKAKSLVGNKFAAMAGIIDGFELANTDTDMIEIIVNADDSKNIITFLYKDVRKTVGVFTQIRSDETTREKISEAKYVIGSEATVIPPYMKNHLVTGYIINVEAMVQTDPEVFGSLVLAVNDNMSIVFVYEPVEEIVNDRFINVTIKGITGAVTHYSYLKRIAKNTLPLMLKISTDVFDVSGYVLDSTSDFDVTASTIEKTFNYYPLATTVTIRMADGTGADVAESFAVSATAGAPFTYNAPNVPDYYLTGNSLGKANPVLADGASEIIFTYAKITSKVTMIAKEDDTNGRIIGMFEISNPAVGTTAYNVPDLTADYYTAKTQIVEITYDGTNSVNAEVYYTKDMASVNTEAVDYLTGSNLGAQTPLMNQRKGEAVTVEAPNISNYVLVGNPTQIVIADGVNKAVFQYRRSENNEVIVKAVDSNGNILQSYILEGSVGETVQATPPAILGWKTSDTVQKAIIGTDSEILFNYTKNVVTVTINTVDSEGHLLGSADTEVAKGGSYTAYAPHITGYVIYGSSSYALNNLAADETVTFIYKTVESAVVTVTIIGTSADGELYRYNIIRAKNSGNYAVDARIVGEYRLLSATPAVVDVKEEDETVIFDYESIFTTVTINMIDEDTSNFLAIFYNKAVTGESYTFNAPNIAGYYLTSTSVIGRVSPVLPNGASEIIFLYKKIASNVTIIARENDTNGRVIRIFPAAEITANVNAPDLTADFYTAITPTVSITYDGSNSVRVEAYYTKDLVDIPIKAVDCATGSPLTATPDKMTNRRKGEVVTISAPSVTDYTLAGNTTQTVIADGSEITFTFCHN